MTEAKLILNFYAFGTYAEPGLMDLFKVQNVDDDIKCFFSSEYITANVHPKLIINFYVP